MELKEIFT